MNGNLIVLEGLDGSGKATQAELLYSKLRVEGQNVRKVTFPDYESDSSAPIRMYLNGEIGDHADDVNAYAASSFYAVDRYISYYRDWKEFLESGGIVIADRYTTSNAIYQCSKLLKEQWDGFLDWLFDYEYKLLGIPKPDLVIYLHVDREVSKKLLDKRYCGDESKKDIHEADEDYLTRAQEAADYCAKKYKWRIIPCSENEGIRTVKELHKEIMGILSEYEISFFK